MAEDMTEVEEILNQGHMIETEGVLIIQRQIQRLQ